MVGPTASGKTRLGIVLAERLGAEIVSVDSMQVYRGMDIGTAKATREERDRVWHHMVDVVDPAETFDVARFRAMGRPIIERSDRPLVIVGGSGLHFRALVDPMSFAPSDSQVREDVASLADEVLVSELLEADSEAGNHVDLANRRRVIRAVEILRLGSGTPTERAATPEARAIRDYVSEIPFRAIGLDPGRRNGDRIRRRTAMMREMGLLEEVSRLAPVLGPTARGAVGYRQLLPVVEGDISQDDGFAAVESATNRLVKRQRTYFRRDPRISWLKWDDDPAVRQDRALRELGH